MVKAEGLQAEPNNEPSAANKFYAEFIAMVAGSFASLLNESLASYFNLPAADSRTIYQHNKVALLAHNNESSPRFVYANSLAQALFAMKWPDIVGIPSSRSAATSQAESERASMLGNAMQNGYIRNYSGLRIDANGSVFQIDNAIIWNIMHPNTNKILGQAALVPEWHAVDS